MPARELVEWMEYEQLEPFGQWRDNYHAAMIAHILANAHRASGKPPIPMSDFMYRDPLSHREEQDAAMVAFLDARVKDGD